MQFPWLWVYLFGVTSNPQVLCRTKERLQFTESLLFHCPARSTSTSCPSSSETQELPKLPPNHNSNWILQILTPFATHFPKLPLSSSLHAQFKPTHSPMPINNRSISTSCYWGALILTMQRIRSAPPTAKCATKTIWVWYLEHVRHRLHSKLHWATNWWHDGQRLRRQAIPTSQDLSICNGKKSAVRPIWMRYGFLPTVL